MNKKTILGIVFLVIFLILGGGYLIAAYVGAQSVKKEVQKYLQENDLQDKVKIQKYSYNPLTGKISLEGISIRGLPQPNPVINIEKIEILEYYMSEGFKTPVRFEAYVYGMDTDINGENFRYDFYQKLWYDPKKEIFHIEKVQIKNSNLKMEFSAVLKHFSPELLKLDPQKNQTEYVKHLLKIFPSDIVISYTDKGFVDKIIKEAAEKENINPAKLKEELISELKTYTEKYQDTQMKNLAKGALQIIQNGSGNITVKIKAKKEITVDKLLVAFMLMGSMSVSDVISILKDYYDAEITYGRATS